MEEHDERLETFYAVTKDDTVRKHTPLSEKVYYATSKNQDAQTLLHVLCENPCQEGLAKSHLYNECH